MAGSRFLSGHCLTWPSPCVAISHLLIRPSSYATVVFRGCHFLTRPSPCAAIVLRGCFPLHGHFLSGQLPSPCVAIVLRSCHLLVRPFPYRVISLRGHLLGGRLPSPSVAIILRGCFLSPCTAISLVASSMVGHPPCPCTIFLRLQMNCCINHTQMIFLFCEVFHDVL